MCSSLCMESLKTAQATHNEAVPRRWRCTIHRRSESRAHALKQQVLLTLCAQRYFQRSTLYVHYLLKIKTKTEQPEGLMSPASSFCREKRSSLKSQDESPGALDLDLLSQTINRNAICFSLHHPFPAHCTFSCSFFLSCAIAILLTPCGSGEVDSHSPYHGPERGLRQA